MKGKAILILSMLFVSAFGLGSCKKREGCTNEAAVNYDKKANIDDGSCVLPPDSAKVIFFFVADSTCGLLHAFIDGDTVIWEFSQALFHPDTTFFGYYMEPGSFNYDIGDNCNTWADNFTLVKDQELEIVLPR